MLILNFIPVVFSKLGIFILIILHRNIRLFFFLGIRGVNIKYCFCFVKLSFIFLFRVISCEWTRMLGDENSKTRKERISFQVFSCVWPILRVGLSRGFDGS